MQVTPHVEALQQDLAAVAGVGDAGAREAAQRLAAALETSLRLRILDVVTSAAHELTPQLPDGHVDVRLTAGEPTLVYVEDAPDEGAATMPTGEDAYTGRI